MFDPGVIMQGVFWSTGRTLSNLIPRAWERTSLIGAIAKCVKCITLDRPDDCKQLGRGTIKVKGPVENATVVHGIGTDFSSQVQPEDYITVVDEKGHRATAKVQSITDASGLRLYGPLNPSSVARNVLASLPTSSRGVPYFLARKLARTNLYNHTAKVLGEGDGILIFPEGFSHEGNSLMPFHCTSNRDCYY